MLRKIFGGLIILQLFLNPILAKDKKDDPDQIGNRKIAHKSIISLEKEIAIGKQYATEIDRSAKLVTDPVITEYVNRLSQNIARNSDLKIPLTVKVIDSPEINAFALPGGFLYVDVGLLVAADQEAQVAGVLAHEIAHIAARHWASQMTKGTLLQYALTPLIFAPIPVYIMVMENLNVGVPIAFLKFSRGAEAEADYLGLQYLYKAGYDPETYLTIFQKLIQEERKQPGSVPKIFMDHPPTPERILKLQEQMKTFAPKDQYLMTTSEFEEVKTRLQKLMVKAKHPDKKEGEPTLKKTEKDEAKEDKKDKNKEEDKPPILRRRN